MVELFMKNTTLCGKILHYIVNYSFLWYNITFLWYNITFCGTFVVYLWNICNIFVVLFAMGCKGGLSKGSFTVFCLGRGGFPGWCWGGEGFYGILVWVVGAFFCPGIKVTYIYKTKGYMYIITPKTIVAM